MVLLSKRSKYFKMRLNDQTFDTLPYNNVYMFLEFHELDKSVINNMSECCNFQPPCIVWVWFKYRQHNITKVAVLISDFSIIASRKKMTLNNHTNDMKTIPIRSPSGTLHQNWAVTSGLDSYIWPGSLHLAWTITSGLGQYLWPGPLQLTWAITSDLGHYIWPGSLHLAWTITSDVHPYIWLGPLHLTWAIT